MYRKVISLGLVSVLCLTAAAGAGTVKINFQLRGAAIPPGYMPDYGQAYGPQGNGFSYGWSRSIEADARERNSANAPDQRYDTLVHLQKGAAAIWEIEVPNGTFKLHIVAGDPSNQDETNNFNVEGTQVVDATPNSGYFDEYDVTVEVKDGRLTIQPGTNAANSKIMWVDITGDAFDQLLGKAKNPSPANGEEGLTMPLFTWTPGATAALHYVYLGTSPELTEADRVSPPLTSALYWHTGTLIPGGVYFWRVDEVTADGKTVYTGDVWTFSAASITAFRPTPKDGAKWVDPNAELSWKPGKDAVTHDLYLDTDKAAVEAGTSSVAQKGSYVANWRPDAALTPGTIFYWRVDETAADGTKTPGAVWSFTTLPAIPIADENLLGWWKMDEGDGATVVDWSGHGHHLTLATPAPAWGTGHFGGALEFAGTGDSAASADSTFLNGLDALTVTAWIKSDVTNTDKGFIIFTDPVGNDEQDIRYDAAGSTGGGTSVLKMGIGVSDGTTTTILQLESSNASQSTDWQHVTLVWKSGQALQFYINGKLDAPTANSTPVNGTLIGFSKVVLGKGGKDTVVTSWDGLIDEISVYGKTLTQEEIQLVMRGDPLLAWDPSPANGSTTDEVGAVPLTWQAGDQAVRHDVYLGTDATAVAAADAADTTGIYRGRQSGTSFTPDPALVWGQKYSWRVDEVNGDGSISTGFVWSFTLADYLIVDEFESYNDDEGTDTRIYETWIDGYTDTLSGSTVGNLDPPFAEQTIVHGGRQSMPMDYNNTGAPYYFSQAYREFAPLGNWTVHGLTDLSLWVRGSPAALAPVTDNNGKMTVSGEGTDIWGNGDQFTFVFKTLSSDGTLIARVTSIGAGTNTWAKGGVMIRDGLEAGSTHAMMVLSANTDGTAGNGCSFQYRNTADGTSANADGAAPALKPPYYVKIERKGDTLSGWVSPDNNNNWTQIGTAQYIAMSAPAYIGLCVSSHAAGAYRTFEFDNVKATGAGGSWQTKEIGLTRNSVQPLYVIVEDSTGKQATVVDPNAAVVNSTKWTEWKIPLTDLKAVNLSRVKALYVGVGDKANTAPDGTGRVYIDDIRVTKP